MKYLKLALISAVVLFGVITAMSLLMPSNVIVSRSIDIHASKDTLLNLVADLKNWPRWVDNYDTTAVSVSSPSSGKGAYINNGNLRVTISKVNNDELAAIWQNGDNKPLQGKFSLVNNSSETTTVYWLFQQHVKWYPWEKFALIVSDKALGPHMEASLDKLKLVAESH